MNSHSCISKRNGAESINYCLAKKFKDEAVMVTKHLAVYLFKAHGKETLSMFTAHYQKEAKNCYWCSNYCPLYSNEKAAQDIIDEKSFSWIKLPDDFSLNSKKRSKTDDSEVDIDDATVITSKKWLFISCAERRI